MIRRPRCPFADIDSMKRAVVSIRNVQTMSAPKFLKPLIKNKRKKLQLML